MAWKYHRNVKYDIPLFHMILQFYNFRGIYRNALIWFLIVNLSIFCDSKFPYLKCISSSQKPSTETPTPFSLANLINSAPTTKSIRPIPTLLYITFPFLNHLLIESSFSVCTSFPNIPNVPLELVVFVLVDPVLGLRKEKEDLREGLREDEGEVEFSDWNTFAILRARGGEVGESGELGVGVASPLPDPSMCKLWRSSELREDSSESSMAEE